MTGRAGAMHIGAAVAALLALLPGAARAQSDGAAKVPQTVASNGVAVPMPEISGLDCRGMATALRQIDQSRYRGAEVVHPGHPDRPIFEYEDRLARGYYNDCLARRNALEDPEAVFAFGFQVP